MIYSPNDMPSDLKETAKKVCWSDVKIIKPKVISAVFSKVRPSNLVVDSRSGMSMDVSNCYVI